MRSLKYQIAEYLDEVGCASLEEIAHYIKLPKRNASTRIAELRRDGYNIAYRRDSLNTNVGIYYRGADQFNDFIDPCKDMQGNALTREYNQDTTSGTHQLCWVCKNATNNGCSWSHKLIPVEGWDATPTAISYEIHQCPQFIPDSFQLGEEE